MDNSSSPDNSISVPNASQPLLYFLIMTIIYGFVYYYSVKLPEIRNNPSFDDFKDTLNNSDQNFKSSHIWTIVYVLLMILGNYFINLNISTSICGETQWGNTFLITLIPWAIIFSVIVLLLMIFPSWISPFSNTIGYLVDKMLGLDDFFKKIIVSNYQEFESGKNKKIPDDSVGTVTKDLAWIYSDPSLLINEINEDNFDSFWTKFTKAGILNKNKISEINKATPSRSVKNTLFNFILLKDIVGTIVWYILTGILVTSVSFNYIVNSNCKRSIKQLSDTHKAYMELQSHIDNENNQVQHLFNYS